jgi:ABC-type multidrug transport system ATPase subunit
MTATLKATNLAAGHGARALFAGLDLVVGFGDVIGLVGANGAGKSTLLRLLAGASLPSRGRRRTAAGLSVGYAPERVVAPPFAAVEYLRHHTRVRRAPAGAAAEVAERLGLGALLDERMTALSKGSLHKVVLTQALAGAPRLLVLDEPFSGLDADARATLAEIVRERAAAGAAVVFSYNSESGPTRPRADARGLVEGGRVGVEHAPLADGDQAAGHDEAARGGPHDDAGGAVARVVDAADSDRVLGEALARGAHVRRVEPLADGRVRIEVDEP